jgi:hypothetical protein
MRAFFNFIEEQGKEVIGAEVGVYTGENAFNVLSSSKCIKFLYLIDPYVPYPTWSPYDLPVALNTAKDMAARKLIPFKNKTNFIYNHFHLCDVNNFGDKLDFVYIDGDHSYSAVKHDIEAADRFVKAGGIIGGHDYQFKEIVKAALEYGSIQSKRNDVGDGIDWWCIKAGKSYTP